MTGNAHQRAIRVIPVTVYVVRSEHPALQGGCECGHHSSPEYAWNDCALSIMLRADRYMLADFNKPGVHERYARVETRLTRLLAYWNRER